MKYLSVCSGVEAASVAWESLGWEPVAFPKSNPFRPPYSPSGSRAFPTSAI